MGGDEFIILLPDTPLPEGVLVADRIRKAIEMLKVPYHPGTINVTVSLGVAEHDTNHLRGWEDIVSRADAAMCEAKEHGRNTVCSH
jgi:diguanylate cyclase (GGDEF)-like protein